MSHSSSESSESRHLNSKLVSLIECGTTAREQDEEAVSYAAQVESKFYAHWIEKRRVFLLVDIIDTYGRMRPVDGCGLE